MKRARLVIPAMLMALTLAGGCVSKSKYTELEGRYRKLKVAKEEALAEAERDCRERELVLSQELDQVREERNRLEEENARLEEEEARIRASEQEKEERLRSMERDMEELQERFRSQLARKDAVISRIENTLKIELVDKLFFRSGSAEITRRGARLLAKVAPLLKQETDKEIRVIGHTDDLPPSPRLKEKYPSNWELSCARAAAIVRALQWGYKIDPRRISAVGVAHYRPVTVKMKGKKARRSNRVVEIILSPLKVR